MLRRIRHEIAGDRHDVGAQIVDDSHRVHQAFARHPAADVQVADLRDCPILKRRMQVFDRQKNALDFDPARLNSC